MFSRTQNGDVAVTDMQYLNVYNIFDIKTNLYLFEINFKIVPRFKIVSCSVFKANGLLFIPPKRLIFLHGDQKSGRRGNITD